MIAASCHFDYKAEYQRHFLETIWYKAVRKKDGSRSRNLKQNHFKWETQADDIAKKMSVAEAQVEGTCSNSF